MKDVLKCDLDIARFSLILKEWLQASELIELDAKYNSRKKLP
jgi:hypothetical protein